MGLERKIDFLEKGKEILKGVPSRIYGDGSRFDALSGGVFISR